MKKNTVVSQQVVQAMIQHLPEEQTMAMVPGTNGVAVKLKNRSGTAKRYHQEKLREQQQSLQTNTSRETLPNGTQTNQTITHTTQEESDDFRLRDVAQLTGFSEQYILLLIERYEVIQPDKTGLYGSRPAYRFTSKEVAQLQYVKSLQEKGRPIREIAHLMSNDANYQKVASSLAKSLGELLGGSSFDEENWQEVVWSISQIPSLSEQEREVLMRVEAHHKNLERCAAEMGLQSAKEVKVSLDSAYSKLGSVILYLLRLAAER